MSAAAKPRDPRSIVTTDAFRVAPELLGLPLGRPSRRAAAVLIDLVLLSAISAVTSATPMGGLILAIAIAAVFFRIATRPGATALGRVARGAFGCLAAFVVFVAIVAVWGVRMASRDTRVRIPMPGGQVQQLTLGQLGSTAQVILSRAAAVRTATNEAERIEAASEIVDHLTGMGISPDAMEDALNAIAESADTVLGPQITSALRAAVAAADTLPRSASEPADSLALRYAAALAANDTAAAALLRPRLTQALAGGQIQRLEGSVRSLEERNDNLEEQLDEARDEADQDPGIFRMLRALADDLGIGFGWAAVYFTVFTTLWKGQTPGKRMLKLRVLRLDGSPIGWWIAFERFGGYAAGIATGLLGFAQILWDPNRQAVHDKIVATVVVRAGQGTSTAGAHRRA
ncbi:MAG: RDD family protein [Gemmatimonadetes bacterium]|nr:RDD family protein [Gemmatimonadota bacterium]